MPFCPKASPLLFLKAFKVITMQLTFSEKISKVQEDFLKYKYACVKNHMDCKRINALQTLEQIKSCQARCQYSYDYA